MAKADHSGEALPIPQRYVDEATRPETEAALRVRLPAKLRQIADNRLVNLAKEAYRYANHPGISPRYKLMAVAALLYFISPFDAITDFIPGVGYVDDAAVLTAFVMSVREAAKEVVSHTQQATSEVVSHAISEAQEAWARRGLSQVCLSLWATTIAASVGLLYYGTKTSVFGAAPSAPLADPFFWGCMLPGMFGFAYHLVFAYRVWTKYSAAPPEIKEPLAYAIVSLADWRQIVTLALPVIALVAVIVFRALV
jgi:uncharacterized membrane protein YkvA (DUF1232 family)